jgi:hypothetical protein
VKGAKAAKAGMSAEKAGVKVATAGEQTAKAGASAERAGAGAETAAASSEAAVKVETPAANATKGESNPAVKPNESGEGQPATSKEGDDPEWVEEVGSQVASSTVDMSVQTSYN